MLRKLFVVAMVAFMDKHKDRIKNVTTYVGEVTLSK